VNNITGTLYDDDNNIMIKVHRLDVVVDSETFFSSSSSVNEQHQEGKQEGKKGEKQENSSADDTRSVRFLCVSDTHGHHESIPMPNDPDLILLHTGDFSTYSTSDYKQFNEWLGTLPYQEIVVMAGNHEVSLPTDSRLAAAELFNATKYLCGEKTINVRGERNFSSFCPILLTLLIFDTYSLFYIVYFRLNRFVA
jgi:hypothetical protein